MKKWNYKTQSYEPYSITEEWNSPVYCSDMDEVINCASCGTKITFGDAFTSRVIHTDKGFGYPVCYKCNQIEFEVEMNYKNGCMK